MTNKREHDRIRLREAFYRAFDSGRLHAAAERLSQVGAFPGFGPVGAGMHFRCFAETAGRSPGGVQLVVKIASREFLDEVVNLEGWVSTLDKVASSDLVPPVEVLRLRSDSGGQGLALVMPFGPDRADQCAAWWQPETALLQGFYQDIGRMNLHLGDVPQLRCWDGIPFICDLSDLRPAGHRG
jgi:hypothetical protein